jgi:hypothetical protein
MPQNKVKRERQGPINLPGFPGYRTRNNRLGLDPLDTAAEQGHMEGLFWRNLFTLRLRTKNPIYLMLMLIGSLFFLWPVPLGIMAFVEKGHFIFLFCTVPLSVPGILLLINFTMSLFPTKPGKRGK